MGKSVLGTKLRDADFTRATGLEAQQFAGSNVTNSHFPDKLDLLDSLKQIEELSRNSRKLMVALLLGCVYASLTLATTEDAMIVAKSASLPLPIIQTKVPITGFVEIAPLLLLGMYFYFICHLCVTSNNFTEFYRTHLNKCGFCPQ